MDNPVPPKGMDDRLPSSSQKKVARAPSLDIDCSTYKELIIAIATEFDALMESKKLTKWVTLTLSAGRTTDRELLILLMNIIDNYFAVSRKNTLFFKERSGKIVELQKIELLYSDRSLSLEDRHALIRLRLRVSLLSTFLRHTTNPVMQMMIVLKETRAGKNP